MAVSQAAEDTLQGQGRDVWLSSPLPFWPAAPPNPLSQAPSLPPPADPHLPFPSPCSSFSVERRKPSVCVPGVGGGKGGEAPPLCRDRHSPLSTATLPAPYRVCLGQILTRRPSLTEKNALFWPPGYSVHFHSRASVPTTW